MMPTIEEANPLKSSPAHSGTLEGPTHSPISKGADRSVSIRLPRNGGFTAGVCLFLLASGTAVREHGSMK